MSDIIKVGALIVLLAFIVAGAGAAYSDTQELLSVTNETVVVDYSTPVRVDKVGGDHVLYDNETVRNSADEILTEGTDYQFFADNGSIKWNNTPKTTAGNNATITYEYLGTDPGTETTSAILIALARALVIIVTLGGGFLVVVAWLGEL